MNLLSISGISWKTGYPFRGLLQGKKAEEKADRFPGYYFVTLYTRSGANYFGTIMDGHLDKLPTGKIAEFVLTRLPESDYGVMVDKWTIMPNHIHLLMTTDPFITSPDRAIRKIKSAIKRWAVFYGQDFRWQGSHQVYLVHDPEEMRRMQWYILKNQMVWHSDSMNRENHLTLYPQFATHIFDKAQRITNRNEIQRDTRQPRYQTQTDSNSS